MNYTSYLRTLLCALSLLISSAVSFAQEHNDTEKLQFIQEQFQASKEYSQLWQYGWLGIFSTSAVVNATLWSESSSRKERFASKVSFITSSLATGDMLINPMPTHGYAKKMAKQEVSLQQAEAWLADAAAKERNQRSLTSHLLSGFVAAASGFAVAKNEHHKTSDGLITFATSFMASEFKIWTSPTNMTQAWNAYQNNDYQSAQQAITASSKTAWQVAAAGPVLYIQYQF